MGQFVDNGDDAYRFLNIDLEGHIVGEVDPHHTLGSYGVMEEEDRSGKRADPYKKRSMRVSCEQSMASEIGDWAWIDRTIARKACDAVCVSPIIAEVDPRENGRARNRPTAYACILACKERTTQKYKCK